VWLVAGVDIPTARDSLTDNTWSVINDSRVLEKLIVD